MRTVRDGWSASVPEAERGPRRRGGETALLRPQPLARLAARGASCGRAYPTACPGRSGFNEKIPIFSPRASSWPIVLVSVGWPGGPERGSNRVARGRGGSGRQLPGRNRGVR
jgi:hypothetical protein